MSTYSVLDARNNLSRLISDARSGIEVVITNRGVPVVQMVPVGRVDAVLNGPALVEWLASDPLPERLRRSPAELDAQIAQERDSWD
ncbi:type II toxin-antitoxin system Phd/YefM family antitoxin [uncultured Microbacterium sp.]|mgnify:CR=1 FL=1|jgi:prevent-host-death family protein|uniref:type II toxin-antitoxin system Phd/YefM family antitoxin n=1 Tax=uncultured Microbacterium sp. TaxID=191216 RepID=UPI002632E0CB|nr:type II toxin-antitoxin system prevent-host-death family antitoxin [uncultured Microbacterium sp.]